VLLPAEVARLRRAEALAALAVLGVASADVQFLDFADGSLEGLSPTEFAGLTSRLADLIRQLQPAEVFTTYRGDGSSEHAAVFRSTAAALGVTGGGVLLEYPVWAWWNPFRLWSRLGQRAANRTFALDAPLRRLKTRALACHQTQLMPTPPWRDPVLPEALARTAGGAVEFFFESRVPPTSPQA
jgi:LmbE family N-acetylglucosaminyl deacetylase